MSIPIMLTQFGLLSMEEAVQLIWDDWVRESQDGDNTIQSDDIQSYDKFGWGVDISGDGTRMAVTAHGEDSGGSEAGAVYVFSRDGNNWTQEQKLLASDAASGDLFGYGGISMSEDGSRLIVGAPYEDANGWTLAGSAYVFSRSGTTWTQEQKLTPPTSTAWDFFGYSVAMSEDGSRVIVGLPGDSSTVNINGDAYVFSRSGTTWTQEQKLSASDGATDDEFGWSVSITGDGTRVAVGARGSTTNTGSAYVFSRSGTTWTQEQKLTASNASTGDEFGYDVSISKDGTRVAVGAPYEDTTNTDSGAVYVFSRSGTTWSEEQLIAEPSVNDYFGWSVSLNEDSTKLAVGSSYNDGVTHVFSRSGTTWTQEQQLDTDSTTSENGTSVSITDDGTRIVSSSPWPTGFVEVHETALVDPSTIPEFIDSKNITFVDSRSFDAVGDLTLTDLTFEAGDLIFINITSNDFYGQVFTWAGDVDFTELSRYSGSGNSDYYHGYAVLDGTETDIYLDPTTTGVDKMYISIVQIAIFRNTPYMTGKAGSDFSTIGTNWVINSTSSAKGHELILACFNFKDDRSISSTNVTSGTYIDNRSYNGPGTSDIGASLLYGVVDRLGNPITVSGTTSEVWGTGQGYRFSNTEPAIHSVNVIGTNSGTFLNAGYINSYAEGIALPAGISTGDIMVVQVSSSGDADSDFGIRVNGLSGSQDMTVLTRSSSSSFVAGTFWLELNTTTLGSDPRIYIINGGSNIDNNSICLAVFDGSTLSGLRGEANTQYLASGMPRSLGSTDWVHRGSLIIQAGSSDGAAVAHTAPTGYTQAVAVNNSTSSSCSINYKTDIETGLLVEGNDYGGGGSSQNLSVMVEFLSS